MSNTNHTKPSTGILVLHGLTGNPETVLSIEEPLKSLGLKVSIPVLRGHGKDSPESLRGVTWQDWVSDAETALLTLLNEVEKVIVIGHSMGGLVAIMLGAKYKDKIDSLILVAAAILPISPLAPGKLLNFMVPLASRLFNKWPIGPVYSNKVYAVNHPNYLWAPMDTVLSFLEFTDVARKHLGKIEMPLLILQSRVDTRIAAKSADVIYNEVSTPSMFKQILWFEKTDHEMFRDCEKDAVVEKITKYIKVRC